MAPRLTIVDLGNGRLILEQGKHRIRISRVTLMRLLGQTNRGTAAQAKALFVKHPERWDELSESSKRAVRLLNPYRTQAVLDALRGGETYKAAGEKVGVSVDAAYQIAKKATSIRNIKDLALKRKWYPTRLELVASYDDSSNVRLARALFRVRELPGVQYDRRRAHRWALKLIQARPKTALGAALALLEFRWQDAKARANYEAGGQETERADAIWKVWCEWVGRRRRVR